MDMLQVGLKNGFGAVIFIELFEKITQKALSKS